MTDSPAYELIKYNGHNEKYKGKMVRLYPDGSIRNERGYFVEKHPETQAITAENANALARKRWEKYQQAAADAVRDAIGAYEPSATTPFAAWGYLNGKTAEAIYLSQKPRGRDLEYLGRNMGAIAAPFERTDGEKTSDALSILASLGAEMVEHVIRQARERE